MGNPTGNRHSSAVKFAASSRTFVAAALAFAHLCKWFSMTRSYIQYIYNIYSVYIYILYLYSVHQGITFPWVRLLATKGIWTYFKTSFYKLLQCLASCLLVALFILCILALLCLLLPGYCNPNCCNAYPKVVLRWSQFYAFRIFLFIFLFILLLFFLLCQPQAVPKRRAPVDRRLIIASTHRLVLHSCHCIGLSSLRSTACNFLQETSSFMYSLYMSV